METDPNDPVVSAIRVRVAKSGRVSLAGDPITLSKTGRTEVVMVPVLIPRSGGDELAIKIVTYVLDAHQVRDRVEKSVSLNHDATHRLHAALRERLSLEGHHNEGQYLVLRVAKGVADVAALDPATVAKAIAELLRKRDVVSHLASKELGAELLNGVRAAIRLQELRAAVAELRENLERGVAEEQIYQDWCDRHPWAFGSAYVMRDLTRTISAGDRVDVLLPSVMGGYRDIVELKRPNMEVLQFDASHGNFYWAAEASRAIGQCHRYLDVLHEEAAHGLRDHPEIVAYHPRATIVIGRSRDWPGEKVRALHGLNRRMNGISVMTYDQLLAQGERLVQVASAAPAPLAEE